MKNLTVLEKKVLREALSEGYIYDATYDPEAKAHFLCWGFEGKEERGAVSSLVKKGLLSIDDEDGDTYVYLLISREEAEELSKEETPAEEPKMKKYEVVIDERVNSTGCIGNLPVVMIVSAEHRKQARDFAYELFQPEYKMSRGKVKIVATRFKG